MNGIIEWLNVNREWLFSGIGIFVLGAILAIIRKKKNTSSQKIKSGSNSINIQAGHDIQFGSKPETSDVEEE